MSVTTIQITFYPGGRRVSVQPGITLIEAAARAGLVIDTPCGGGGTCGKCRVRFDGCALAPASAETALLPSSDLEAGWRLACQTRLSHDAIVHVPTTALFGGVHQIQTKSDRDMARVPDGDIRRLSIQMQPPNMADSVSDLTRMERALAEKMPTWDHASDRLCASPELLRVLGGRLRATRFKGVATLRGTRLIDYVAESDDAPLYAIAFDIGTTTVVGALLDMETGAEHAVVSAMNPQTVYGDDVLSRIAHASRDAAALDELRDSIMAAVRDSIRRLCEDASVDARQICHVVVTGNTTMQHLVCGFSPASLGMAPFVPLYKHGLVFDASAAGLELHPAATAYVFPVVGGFVGGDTVAGLLAADIRHGQSPALMIDIGTNGEIVLFHDGMLHAASTAAGPAFEGARISCGMRATTGAIEKVTCADDLVFDVIGGGVPRGLCGSGLIDLCGVLLKTGALGVDGRLLAHDTPVSVPSEIRRRLRVNAHDEPMCVLHEPEGAAPIALSQKDIREVQLGAGAIRAGTSILLKQAGIAPQDLKQVLIAGGFGSFIRRDNAQRIGIIPPEIAHDTIRFAGNVAFSGAKWVALSGRARDEAEALADSIVHVELNQDPDFAMEFAMAMQFPG